MAGRRKEGSSFRALIDRFTQDLASAISLQVEQEVSSALARVRSQQGGRGGAKAAPGRDRSGPGAADGRLSGRLCPVTGCGKPGAGPRNRWFCKEHSSKLSVSEQKGILERNRRLAAEGKLPTQVASQRIVRLPPKNPRPRRMLDMSCRVEGCPNRSGGPRSGFICEAHRAQLTPAEQLQAREAWKLRQKGAGEPASAGQAPEVRPVAAPVPPILRKAPSDAAEAAAEG